MEDGKIVTGEVKTNSTIIGAGGGEEERNPNHNNNHSGTAVVEETITVTEEGEQELSSVQSSQPSSRTPFSNLSQVDADLALARTLQEQERAYMMLMLNNEGSDYGSWETSSYTHEDDFDDTNDGTDVEDDNNEDDVDEHDGTDVDDDVEDASDVHADDDDDEENDDNEENDEDGDGNNTNNEVDPAAFPDDEAYARALQDAEEQEMAARMLALAWINDRANENTEVRGVNSQDTWEEVDPDELSYEELLALGEIVGTESRGLSASSIATLPSVNYKMQNNQEGNNDSCVICRLDYEDGDTLTVLSCKHLYHPECINNWLQINKVCPVCSNEVSTSESR